MMRNLHARQDGTVIGLLRLASSRCLRWGGVITVLLALFWTTGMSSASAIGLGDLISATEPTTWVRLGPTGKSYRSQTLESGSERVTALANPADRVFRIQIKSTAETPPDPIPFLGEYANFPAETVTVIPLRGKVVHYQQGDRTAEWSVVGMSGSFSAQATSLDLTPSELQSPA